MKDKTTDWRNLYGETWKGIITPAAFAHPAKFARGLIRKIYLHAFNQGWVKEGDRVLDPFGGVGLGGFDAARLGLHWTGVELEKRFYILGNGMACPGIDAAFWRRYQGRGGRWLALGICPDCGDLLDTNPPMLELFGKKIKAIPSQAAHRYGGNIGAWRQTFANYPGSARLINGDSRFLLSYLAEAEPVDLAISSPPYEEVINSGKNGIDWNKAGRPDRTKASVKRKEPTSTGELKYGETEGQLGAMPAKDFDLAISSPPFGQAQTGGGIAVNGYQNQEKRPGSEERPFDLIGERTYTPQNQGESDGQLANMPTKGFDLAISSPPYEESQIAKSSTGVNLEKQYQTYRASGGGASFEKFVATQQKHTTEYGITEGQLGAMPAKGFDLSVSSPPYEQTRIDGNGDEGSSGLRDENGNYLRGPEGWKIRKEMGGRYGETEGQLGGMATDFWTAARSIVDQVFAALKPGGVAVWVVKDFVRNKQVDPFCEKWRILCEAAGFETVCQHRAWLVEEVGNARALFDFDDGQGNLVQAGQVVRLENGEVKKPTKERKSFFKRLHEKKGGARVDWEMVICMQKPGVQPVKTLDKES